MLPDGRTRTNRFARGAGHAPKNVSKDGQAHIDQMEGRLLDAWFSGEPELPTGPRIVISDGKPPPRWGQAVASWRAVEPGLHLDLANGRLRQGGLPVVQCSLEHLPIEDACMGLVLVSQAAGFLSHQGLDEICRIVRPGGTVLVSAVNRHGLGGLGRGSKNTTSKPVGVAALSLRKQLESREMQVTALQGAGFVRSASPRDMSRGLARLLTPLADFLLVEARKAEPPVSRLVPSKPLRAVGAPSALAGR